MARENDWLPDDENEDRDLYKCLSCGKEFSAPSDFECYGYCRICQQDYELVE